MLEQSASMRSRSLVDPPSPGPKREDRGHGRDAVGDGQAARRSSATFGLVVVRELRTPRCRSRRSRRPRTPRRPPRRRRPTVEISDSESFTARRRRRAASRAKQARRSGGLRQLLARRGSRSRRRGRGRGACSRRCARGCSTGVSWPGACAQRAPEEVLVERARAAVDVAADEVDVRRLDVGGGEDDAPIVAALEVLRCDGRAARRSGRRTPRAAPPSTCRRRRRARPLRRPSGRDGSSWSWIQRIHEPSGAREGSTAHGLAADDRRLGGEEAAVGLVDRARDAVEAGRDVDDRRPAEALVAPPVGRLAQGEVDLHLAAAVAEAARRVCHAAGASRRSEQPPVELRRRHARDDRARRRCIVSPPASRTPVARPSETSTRSTSAPVRSSPPASRARSPRAPSTRLTPPPFGTGIPPSWSAAAITWVMKPGRRLVGPEAGVQHPGREQAVRLLRARTSPSPSRGRSRACRPVNSSRPRRPKRR